MKVKNKKNILNCFLEWIIYMIGYSLILITLSVIFPKTIQIDHELFGIYALITEVIIFILNKTIKPIIVSLTIPITALSLGIFYPFINVLILKIVDFIMGSHFTINGIFMSFLIAILISIMNILMDKLILKPLLRKEQKI